MSQRRRSHPRKRRPVIKVTGVGFRIFIRSVLDRDPGYVEMRRREGPPPPDTLAHLGEKIAARAEQLVLEEGKPATEATVEEAIAELAPQWALPHGEPQ